MLANFQLKWKLQVSDPDPWSWLITVLYLVAFILNLKFIAYVKSVNEKNDLSLYFFSASLLFILGLNKQLDLHVLINELAAKIINSFELGQYKLACLIIFLLIISVCLIYASRKLYNKRYDLLYYTKKLSLTLLLLISFCIAKFGMIYAAKFNKQMSTIDISTSLKVLETLALIGIIFALLDLKRNLSALARNLSRRRPLGPLSSSSAIADNTSSTDFTD